MASAEPTPVARPDDRIGALAWLKANLFSSWYNSLITIVVVGLLTTAAQRILVWVFTAAEWDVIAVNLRLLMVGQYPIDQLWRVWACVAIAAGLIGLSWGIWPQIIGMVGFVYGTLLVVIALLAPVEETNRLWLLLCAGLIFSGWLVGRFVLRGTSDTRWVGIAWIVALPLWLLLLYGFGWVLPLVAPNEWGGLLLTFILALSGIVFSFPLGILLAIGRRSELPALSGFCTAYIEVFRGVPLVTVLFMFLIMLPLFVPGTETTDNVIRAIVGFTLFTAAYIAENVRGGLQAIPNGQVEAARALGLNPFYAMLFIVLPQALRIVIPANVSQFVSLFKDTSLVVVAGGGMLELLGVARSILGQTEFLASYTEVLAFVAVVYWTFAYSMTYASRRLERELSTDYR